MSQGEASAQTKQATHSHLFNSRGIISGTEN